MFFDEEWTTNVDIRLFTDASYDSFGAFYNDSWISEPFSEVDQAKDITWKELYAIVSACSTWGHLLMRKRLLLYCDNLAVVNIINNGSSKKTDLMILMRTLFYICAKYNIECSASHIAGVRNGIADALSRRQLVRFRLLAPNADQDRTQLVKPHEQYELSF